MTCHDCGNELVVHDGDSVEPCEDCMRKARREGFDDGFEAGSVAQKLKTREDHGF